MSPGKMKSWRMKINVCNGMNVIKLGENGGTRGANEVKGQLL